MCAFLAFYLRTSTPPLPKKDLSYHQMLNVNLRPLEPLSGIHRVPKQRQRHHTAIYKAGVVHGQFREMRAANGWEAEDRDDEEDP